MKLALLSFLIALQSVAEPVSTNDTSVADRDARWKAAIESVKEKRRLQPSKTNGGPLVVRPAITESKARALRNELSMLTNSIASGLFRPQRKTESLSDFRQKQATAFDFHHYQMDRANEIREILRTNVVVPDPPSVMLPSQVRK